MKDLMKLPVIESWIFAYGRWFVCFNSKQTGWLLFQRTRLQRI